MLIQSAAEMRTFIDLVRLTDPYMKIIFTQGSCYRFHLLLNELTIGSIAMVNKEISHVVTYFDGKYFDITGEIFPEYPEQYQKIPEDILQQIEEWSFFNNNRLKVGECECCGEPYNV